MRILYISSLYAPQVAGGAERVLQAQAEAMHEAGHSVGVLALSNISGLHRDTVNGIPVWRAGQRNVYFHYDELLQAKASRLRRTIWHVIDTYNPLMNPFIRKVVEEFHPDIASVHNLNGWSIAAWDALKALRVPIVQVLHDQYLLCPTATMFCQGRRCEGRCASSRILRAPHHRKLRQVDAVVGVSRFICDKLESYGYLKDLRRVTAIANVRDVSGESIPLPSCNDPGATHFGFIGTLSPSKGIEFLLETITRIGSHDWTLSIAGGGEVGYVRSLIDRFTDSRVRFLGQMSVREFFEGIDVTVIPSLWEDTSPSVAFESLLYGRPVLGSRSGGIPELVNDSNGRLFTPGDAADLEKSMRWAITNRDRLRSSAHTISSSASQFADKAKWVDDWSRVYEDVVRNAALTGRVSAGLTREVESKS